MKPLEGIRVLDLTRALAGPFCTLMLGDYGADVIKIEIPGSGDDTRTWGPPFIGEESAYFLSINRNKRSLTLNFKEEKARQIFLDLAKNADVVVENFTPGVMDRFGLGYDAVKAVNPGIVFCSISGFGQTGPYKSRPAYDQIMQGISGLMSITGEPDGDPQKVGIAVADIGAGMWAAFAVMAAIHNRSHEGEGQGRPVPPAAHRRGPVHRHLNDGRPGGLAHLSGGQFLRHRRGAQTFGRGPSQPGALPRVHVPRQ